MFSYFIDEGSLTHSFLLLKNFSHPTIMRTIVKVDALQVWLNWKWPMRYHVNMIFISAVLWGRHFYNHIFIDIFQLVFIRNVVTFLLILIYTVYFCGGFLECFFLNILDFVVALFGILSSVYPLQWICLREPIRRRKFCLNLKKVIVWFRLYFFRCRGFQWH